MTKTLPKRRPRRCGACTACCTHIKCDALNKPAGTPCRHVVQLGPQTGCEIYDQRPHECKCFTCGWLDGLVPLELRPDRCGFIVESAWLNLPDKTRLVMLFIIDAGGDPSEHLDELQAAVRKRTVVVGPDFILGHDSEDVSIYEAWRKSVIRDGVYRAVDCDGTVIETVLEDPS